MGLGCGEGGWQSKSLQRHTCTCGQVTGKDTAFPLPLYNSKLSCGERESTAAEPAPKESRFILKTRWLLQETSMWRKNTWISYSKGGLGKKWQTPRMQGFRFSGDQLDSEALLEVCREPGLALLHVLLGRREKNTAWHFGTGGWTTPQKWQRKCGVCNVYIWGSIVQHTKLFGNTEK